MQSDAEIQTWRSLSFPPYEQSATAQRIQEALNNIQKSSTEMDDRMNAIRNAMNVILVEMPVASKSKVFLFGLRAQMVHVLQQATEKDAPQSFQEECSALIQYVDRILDILYPKPALHVDETLVESPTDAMRSADLVDPVSLESLESGTLYAFYKGHLIGSRETLQDMIQRSVRGSDTEAVFVPLQNRLIPVNQIQWIQW